MCDLFALTRFAWITGAIDTVPLGGLVGENIFLVPERVRKMCGRLRKWVDLRWVEETERWLIALQGCTEYTHVHANKIGAKTQLSRCLYGSLS